MSEELELQRAQLGYAYNRMNQLASSTLGPSDHAYNEMQNPSKSDEDLRYRRNNITPPELSKAVAELVGQEFAALHNPIRAIVEKSGNLERQISRTLFPKEGEHKMLPAYSAWLAEMDKLTDAIKQVRQDFAPVYEAYRKRYLGMELPKSKQEVDNQQFVKYTAENFMAGFSRTLQTAEDMCFNGARIAPCAGNRIIVR